MSRYPKKLVIDTNVPKTANLALAPANVPHELTECVLTCIEAIEHVVKNGGLVIDAKDEIFDEYRQNLSMSGQPGVGDRFMKWVHDNRWNFPDSDRVAITKDNVSYKEFPTHKGLVNFDLSDRKFVAVAKAHHEDPPIYQATDSKWWGWKDALEAVGINVTFICPDYIEKKYMEKIDT